MGGLGGRDGSAAVEFAIVGPLFIALLAAMAVYGGWFWIAQSVQTTASEAARAAVAGLDDAERKRLALAAAAESAGRGLNPDRLELHVDTAAESIRVRAVYDVHDHPVMMLKGLLPSPPSRIERSAVIREGGR